MIRLFRGPLLVVIFLFLLGINIYGWGTAGVNHVLIFELDPRNHLSYQQLMELGAIFGVLWTVHLLIFLFSEFLGIPTYAVPLSLTITMVLFMINPTKTMMHGARFWLLKFMGRIFAAPFFPVAFADFWLADQLNSLATGFTDFHYMACFYLTPDATLNNEFNEAVSENLEYCTNGNWVRAIFSALPAWFRFAQCLRRYKDTREAFPHLVNAGKYSTTLFVVLFKFLDGVFLTATLGTDTNIFFILWMISQSISSCYAYTWDIKMDWGLMDKNTENTLLREETVYSSKNYYYFAIIEDFILRFGWTVSISLAQIGFFEDQHKEWLPSFMAMLEVFRRFVWNFFRLENEHLNNCGKFRAVRDISVAPIDASDQAEIIRMMDEPDGVMTVRKRKTTKSHSKNKGKSDLLKPLLDNEQFSSVGVLGSLVVNQMSPSEIKNLEV